MIADRAVGASPQLPVTRAVAVRPHVGGHVPEPRVEAAGLLGAADVRAHEPSGEPAVAVDLELGGEDGVEAQALGDRADVHPERGGDDHQAVPLGPVPVDAVDGVGAQVPPHDVEGEGPAQLVEPLGVVSREDAPDDVGLHRVRAAPSAPAPPSGRRSWR